ncbi:MAG: PKD domain-containing protein [Syntrophobacteraceae bacterium]
MTRSHQSPGKTAHSTIFSLFSFSFFLSFLVLMVFAVSAQATLVNFQWNASTGAVAGYKLYQGTTSGSYDLLKTTTVPGTGTTGSMDLEPAASHYVAAKAYDSSQRESAFSNEILCHPVTVTAGAGGAISPGGTFFAQNASNVTFTLTPNSGYRVNSLLVNGTSVGGVTSYTVSGITSGTTVSAVFEPIPPTSYTITASSNNTAYGTVSPSGGVSVALGGTRTITITALTGYHIQDVKVDNVSVGAVPSYTFSNVTANHSLAATFAINTYAITASAGSNGSISPTSATVNHGSNQSFTVTPSTGYQVQDVKVDGSSVGAVTSYNFTSVTAPHTISATFTIKTFAISVTVGPNGSISPSSATVNQGSSQTFTITPNTGYQVEDVKVDGASVGAVTSYNFTSVTAPHTISATFAIKTYAITASAGSNGSISPSGSVSVNHGANASFTITPASGYQIDRVLVDGASVGAVGTYAFNAVTSAHTIAAQFVQRANQAPVANAGPDQTVSEGATVTLSGAGSSDPDDGISSYSWKVLTGPQVTIINPTSVSPTLVAPNIGPEGVALELQLTVKDVAGLTSTDTCLVNVRWVNEPPIANAGPSRTVAEGVTVQLDGSGSTDSDDGVASYAWVQKTGSTVGLVNANTATPTFMAPNVGTGGTSVSFELTVTDQGGLKSTAQTLVNVTWVNTPPVANAGSDQTGYEGAVVTLNGSASTDTDDGIETYSWTQLSGSPVSFVSSAGSAQAAFTAPAVAAAGEVFTFMLTVEDAGGLKSTDTCTVTVSDKPGPDLTASWSSLTYKSNRLSGSLSVRNVGTSSAGYSYVAFYLSTDGKTLNKYITRKAVTTTAAGQSRAVSFAYSKSGLSGQYIVAVLDYTNRVTEVAEDNNVAPVVIPVMTLRR